MNSKRKINRIYLPILTATVLISTVFRIAAMFKNFNLKTGYYDGKSLVNVSWIVIISGCVLLLSYAFVGSKTQKLIPSFATPRTYVPTGAVCVSLLFFSLFMVRRLAFFGFFEEKKINSIPEALALILAVLSIFSVAYFMLNACVFESSSIARATFGLATVILLAFYASYLYFDTTLPINSPNKIVDQMAYVLSALFFLYETRISLGRECWNLYMAFGFLAAAFTAYSSIPSLLLYLIKGSSPSNNIYETALTLALFIFIISRITLAATLKEDKESEIVLAMRDFARERDEEIKEAEKRKQEAYLELYNTLGNLKDTESEEYTSITDDSAQLSLDDVIGTDTEATQEVTAKEEASNEEIATYTEDGFIQEQIEIPEPEEKKPEEKEQNREL